MKRAADSTKILHSETPKPLATRRAYRAMCAEAKRVGWPKRFRKDLFVWDRAWLLRMPDAQPFLWALCECGTCLYLISEAPIDEARTMAWDMPSCIADAFGADQCRFYIWDGHSLLPFAGAEPAAERVREIALERRAGRLAWADSTRG